MNNQYILPVGTSKVRITIDKEKVQENLSNPGFRPDINSLSDFQTLNIANRQVSTVDKTEVVSINNKIIQEWITIFRDENIEELTNIVQKHVATSQSAANQSLLDPNLCQLRYSYTTTDILRYLVVQYATIDILDVALAQNLFQMRGFLLKLLQINETPWKSIIGELYNQGRIREEAINTLMVDFCQNLQNTLIGENYPEDCITKIKLLLQLGASIEGEDQNNEGPNELESPYHIIRKALTYLTERFETYANLQPQLASRVGPNQETAQNIKDLFDKVLELEAQGINREDMDILEIKTHKPKSGRSQHS